MEKGRLIRFFIPYLDSHGQEILHKLREDFTNVVETESCRLNGGFTKLEGEGGYINREGKLIREKVTIIETYGQNPLPPERMRRCRRYLAQESLVVMETGSCEFIDYKRGADITVYRHPAEPPKNEETPDS